ncbi:MAG: DUF4389 domain-containing protein [bacterium]|nr:DUF4389 domain-containing protein [bacterium]
MSTEYGVRGGEVREETMGDEVDFDSGEIDRVDTVVRIFYTLLFILGLGVLRGGIYVLVAFQLGYTLITQAPPNERIGEVSNRLVAYYYRVLRYLTHNDAIKPFPFTDFPEPVEPSRPQIQDY